MSRDTIARGMAAGGGGTPVNPLTPEQKAILDCWDASNPLQLKATKPVYIPDFSANPMSIWLGEQIHIQDIGNNLAFQVKRGEPNMRSVTFCEFNEQGTTIPPRSLDFEPIEVYPCYEDTDSVNPLAKFTVPMGKGASIQAVGEYFGLVLNQYPTKDITVTINLLPSQNMLRRFIIPVSFWQDKPLSTLVYFDHFANIGLYTGDVCTISFDNVDIGCLKGSYINGTFTPAMSWKVQRYTPRQLATEKYVQEELVKIPTGPKGDKGDKGDIGPKGDRGLQGEQGPMGYKGNTGDTGPKGDTGAKGDKGDIGPKGDKGEPGTSGGQGAKGDKGDRGEQGIQGTQGAQGSKGDQGIQGIQGIKGDKGDKGDPGTGLDIIDIRNGKSPIVLYNTTEKIIIEQTMQMVIPSRMNATIYRDFNLPEAGKYHVTFNVVGATNWNRWVTESSSGRAITVLPDDTFEISGGGAYSLGVYIQSAPGECRCLSAKITKVSTEQQAPLYVKNLFNTLWMPPVGQGPKGDKGDKGDTGLQGIQGIKGDTGLKGDQGIQGIQGLKGDTGAKGDKGDPGTGGKTLLKITKELDFPSGTDSITGSYQIWFNGFGWNELVSIEAWSADGSMVYRTGKFYVKMSPESNIVAVCRTPESSGIEKVKLVAVFSPSGFMPV